MPTMPPQQTLMPALAHARQRVEAILVVARGDDLAVELGRGVEVVVVVVEAGVASALGLAVGEHAERAQVSRPSAFTARTIASTFSRSRSFGAPGGAHAEAASRPRLRGARLGHTASSAHQLLGSTPVW
jgi:hypothetical protein